jgi:hypothetical protein
MLLDSGHLILLSTPEYRESSRRFSKLPFSRQPAFRQIESAKISDILEPPQPNEPHPGKDAPCLGARTIVLALVLGNGGNGAVRAGLINQEV